MNKRTVTILLGFGGAIFLVLAIFVASQIGTVTLAPEDTSASGCNKCFSKPAGETCDWDKGYKDGCLDKKGDVYVRNDKPDVDNNGTVQKGDDGKSGKKEGENINSGGGGGGGGSGSSHNGATQSTSGQRGGGIVEEGRVLCKPAGGSYNECCGAGLSRIVKCQSGGEFGVGKCDRSDSGCGKATEGQTATCPPGWIYKNGVCQGGAKGDGTKVANIEPTIGGSNTNFGGNAILGSSEVGGCLDSLANGTSSEACGGGGGRGSGAAALDSGDVNPSYTGFFDTKITASNCSKKGGTLKVGGCGGEGLFYGAVTDGGTDSAGKACCSTSSVRNESCGTDIILSNLSTDLKCQCALVNGNASDPSCNNYKPIASLPTPIVSDCSTASTGSRTHCDGNKQSYCQDGVKTAAVITDYCLVKSNPDRQGLVEGVTDCKTNLSKGEGGFQGCSTSGQVCVCGSDGKVDCFMDTPDGYGYADSCPQPDKAVTVTPVDQGGYAYVAPSSTPPPPPPTGTPPNPPPPNPPPPVSVQCVYLQQDSPGSTTIGSGQTVAFSARYTCASLNNNIALAVLDGTTPVGSPTIVSPDSSIYDGANDFCTYTFTWTATGVSDGDYDVRLLTDGTTGSIVTTPVACTELITLESTTPLEPAISIVKSSGHVCLDDGGARIDYTVTATNSGQAAATVDFVTDELPVGIDGTNTFQVSNVTPAAVRTADTLTWTLGSSLAPGASLNFSYSINLTSAGLVQFASGLNNTVIIQFDTPTTTDNSVTFDLGTLLTCYEPELPETALFDDPESVILLGLLLIIGGILVNRSGLLLNIVGLATPANDATSGIISSILREFTDGEELDKQRAKQKQDEFEREILEREEEP